MTAPGSGSEHPSDPTTGLTPEQRDRLLDALVRMLYGVWQRRAAQGAPAPDCPTSVPNDPVRPEDTRATKEDR